MADQAYAQTRKPVHDKVRDRIQELILKGDLAVGAKLPSERSLAEQFNVSRNSVREALRVLTEHKIVHSRQGDGTYVCSREPIGPTNDLALAVQKQRTRLREIFEFRRLLEPQIAFLAASSITQAEIDRLKVVVFDQERRLIAGEEDLDLDTAFHVLLARAARNTVIVEVLKTLSEILNESRSGSLRTLDRRRASLRTHVLIVDALEKRNAEDAREAMRQHLLQVESATLGIRNSGELTEQTADPE
jgi:GntR family transcriptional regulator, transcriptional repressor for pyruvate dehydrogenase complex